MIGAVVIVRAAFVLAGQVRSQPAWRRALAGTASSDLGRFSQLGLGAT